jgi:hypothetical protein
LISSRSNLLRSAGDIKPEEMTICVILQFGNEETQIETIITQYVTQTLLVNTQWQTQLKDVAVVENKH